MVAFKTQKTVFLKISTELMKDVNSHRDKNRWAYAQKVMIRSGFAKQSIDLSEVFQRFSHLQNIVTKHRNHFNGENSDVDNR